MGKARECINRCQENQRRLDQHYNEDVKRMRARRRLLEEQKQTIIEALDYLNEWELQEEKK
jgi:hypothetical protein